MWRKGWSGQWGPACITVMTAACQHVANVHDRMRVILRCADWADWLDGAPDAAGLLGGPYPEVVVCERTAEMWVRR